MAARLQARCGRADPGRIPRRRARVPDASGRRSRRVQPEERRPRMVDGVGNWKKGVTLSVSPAYYNGTLIVGTSGGDGGGVSSILSAFNAATGQIIWSWSEIPTHGQPGGNTWPLSDRTGSNYGGGAIWENPLIDATDDLVLIGTGNPNPWNSAGPGENLWTDSLVALNVNTGAFVWGYQISHHDEWDSDLPEQLVAGQREGRRKAGHGRRRGDKGRSDVHPEREERQAARADQDPEGAGQRGGAQPQLAGAADPQPPNTLRAASAATRPATRRQGPLLRPSS